jgi:HSF-type DNA-binding
LSNFDFAHYVFNADQSGNARVLGRIVVHDRVLVEANVLPRYFNHSSFASLRRQLNYFSFVRLGKGRQRESTYINEHVVVLDDILHLKRRPSTGNVNPVIRSRMGDPFPVLTLSGSSESTLPTLERRPKRRRPTKELVPTTVSPRSTSPVCNNLVSEGDDDSFTVARVVLDLTKPESKPDADILDGCRSLLFLSAKRW